MHISLEKSDRWSWLELAGNDTEYTAIVTQLRSAWDDQDLRERDRGGKSFGKGRTVHFAEADTEWYDEQNAHRISGDASELEVTWSFDPVGAIWWCGVLDPSIPALDVMDWSEDWSYSESSPYAEDVFPEQSQVLALTSDDASSPECVQQAEVLVAEANRTLAQARSAVAQQNKIAVVSSLLPMCLPVVRAKEKARSKANRKIHRVSSVAEAIISGDSVLNDIRKDLAKDVKMDLARFIWELLGVLILNCLRQWCFKRMLSWIVVRQKQLVESRQCRFWWMQ